MNFITSYLTSWWNTFLASLFQLWDGIAGTFAPLLGAALILLLGWFLAFFLGQVVKKILSEDNIHWDRAFSRIGLSAALKDRLGLSTNVGALLGWLIKWFLVIATFMAAMNVLGFERLNSFLGELVGFLPSAATAALIVFLGFFFGNFIDLVLTRLIGAINVKADIAGAVAKWTLVAFSIFSAAQFLNLPTSLLVSKFVDFLVLAGAIAVGFGFSSRASEWLRNIKG